MPHFHHCITPLADRPVCLFFNFANVGYKISCFLVLRIYGTGRAYARGLNFMVIKIVYYRVYLKTLKNEIHVAFENIF